MVTYHTFQTRLMTIVYLLFVPVAAMIVAVNGNERGVSNSIGLYVHSPYDVGICYILEFLVFPPIAMTATTSNSCCRAASRYRVFHALLMPNICSTQHRL